MSEQLWAVIEPDGVVSNVILADQDFIDSLKDAVTDEAVDSGPHSADHRYVDITDLDPQPAIRWVLKGKKFTPPPVEETAAD